MQCDLLLHNYYTVWKPLRNGQADLKHAESVGHYKGLSKQCNETFSLTITYTITFQIIYPSSWITLYMLQYKFGFRDQFSIYKQCLPIKQFITFVLIFSPRVQINICTVMKYIFIHCY